MLISNIGGSATIGRYKAELFKGQTHGPQSPEQPSSNLQHWKTFEIAGFRRKRFGAWYLLAGILQNFDVVKAFAPRPTNIQEEYVQDALPVTPGTQRPVSR